MIKTKFEALRRRSARSVGGTGLKRKRQILQYGYSPKNAMNVIRLMEQGIELLETANLTMPRPNAQELIAIKKGKLKYDQIVQRFDELLEKLEMALRKTKLPDQPRYEDADNLMIRIIKNQ